MKTMRNAAAGLEEGTVLQGRRPAAPPTPKPVLKMDAQHNFVFLYHPDAWDVIVPEEGSPRLVPRLRRFHFEPGVACVEAVKGAADGDPTRALHEAAKKGWQQVPRDREVTAHGSQYDDYAHQFDGHKGPVTLSVWERPYVRGGNVVIDFDQEGWHAFLIGLVDDGVVPLPDRAVRRAVELEMKTAMRRHQTSAEKSAGASAIAEMYETKVKAFEVHEGGRSRPAPGRGAPGRPPAAPPKATDATRGDDPTPRRKAEGDPQ